jgi:cysteine-rich repeat protein
MVGTRLDDSMFARMAVLAALVISACQAGPGTLCGDGYCGVGYECTADDGEWQCIRFQLCGNSMVEEPEACDDGNAVAGDGCSADCLSRESCGNGVREPGEACDDGNRTSNDGCSRDCVSDETCGNGVIDLGEQCDDGNQVSNDGCSRDCASDETCGNGVVDMGEVCDDDNQVAGDECSADCASNEACGNGVVDESRGEVCDDGNTEERDGCPGRCRYDCDTQDVLGYFVCHEQLDWVEATRACQLHGGHLVIIDDVVENSVVAGLLSKRFWIGLSDAASEGVWSWLDGSGLSYAEWELGEPNDYDGREDCVEANYGVSGSWNDLDCNEQRPFICESSGCADGCECGDGQLEPGEGCDDGNTIPGDGCDADCQIEPECGNGLREPGEECDDGNEIPGDGCDAGCRIELVVEIEPNEDGTPEIGSAFEGNDFSIMNANGPHAASTIISATLQPAGDEDVFAVRNPGAGAVLVRFETHDAAVGQGLPCNVIDTVLLIRDAEGNILTGNDDSIPGSLCSRIDHVIRPGETVYAHVLVYGDSSAIPEPGYWLAIDFQ